MIGRSIGKSVGHSLSSPRITAGGGVSYDTDAQTYITAVEAADGQSLETGVKDAINAFVVGCKSDGIWAAIKASCILAGARTLTGALVPLVGTAPTNYNFVSGDYDRKTGLVGDGSTKYLNSNRNNNADPQDDFHLSAYLSAANSGNLIGAGGGLVGASQLRGDGASRSRSSTQDAATTTPSGFFASSRSSAAEYSRRAAGVTSTVSTASQTPSNESFTTHSTGALAFSNARLAFYSIGESLDLVLLDSRVTTLITDIGTALA